MKFASTFMKRDYTRAHENKRGFSKVTTCLDINDSIYVILFLPNDPYDPYSQPTWQDKGFVCLLLYKINENALKSCSKDSNFIHILQESMCHAI